jgi:hypothetical protein
MSTLLRLCIHHSFWSLRVFDGNESRLQDSLLRLNRGLLVLDIIRHAYAYIRSADDKETKTDSIILTGNISIRSIVNDIKPLISLYDDLEKTYKKRDKKGFPVSLSKSWSTAPKQVPQGSRDFWARLLNICEGLREKWLRPC